MLITAKYLIPKGYRGIAIFPFILVKFSIDTKNKVFVNHEKIHLKQQLEMLVVLFFIWYFLEYFLRLLQFKNQDLAYRNISFEREAYMNETNLEYLKNKRFFSFLKYL